MRIIERFTQYDFDSYEDFTKNYHVNKPDNFNFAYDVTDVLALEKPEKKALVWCNDKGASHTFTFRDMKVLSDKAANFLWSQGIRPHDKVMLILKRHYQYWYLALALHKLGAVVIPATFQLTTKDIKYRVERAHVKMIITADDQHLLDSIREVKDTHQGLERLAVVSDQPREGFLNLDEEVEKASGQWSRPAGEYAFQDTDLMLMYFTSGTTGMPKMVAHDFTYPLGHILTARHWQDLRETDLHLTVADTGWAKCSWGKIYGQWLCEAAIFVYDYDNRFQPTDLLEKIQEYHLTTFCAPPTIYRFLIKEDLSRYDLSSLRACYIAGEPLNPEVYKKWYDITGLKLREGFGQTESPVLVANFKWLEPKPGSCGKPSPSMGIRILDRAGKPCDVGEQGEICINIQQGDPYGIFKGYYEEEEKTSSVKFDGYYHTGDVAWYDEEGYIWFVGRSDDVIKSSGYRIGPFEVESALLEHPAVLEAAITAVPHPVRGQVVKATVVLVKSYQPSEELIKELQDHVKRTTAPYKYPRIVEFVQELPKTTSGKIRRVEIRNGDRGASES